MANANKKSNTYKGNPHFYFLKIEINKFSPYSNQVRRICHADLGLVQLALSLVS